MARPGDEVAAGDGLGAFGAALILPIQTHYWISESSVVKEILALADDHEHASRGEIQQAQSLS